MTFATSTAKGADNVINMHNTDQLAAGQLLQQGHEDVSILYVPEKVMDLNGWVTLKMERREEREKVNQQELF